MLAKHILEGKVVIPYVTFGDPYVGAMDAIIEGLVSAGATVIELGMPFSDPIADGPVIQASHQRALNADPQLSFSTLFYELKRWKKRYPNVYFLVMCDVNLIMQYEHGWPTSVENWFKDAKAAGLDGAIIPNLPIEEAGPYLAHAKKTKVPLIQLVSPLCPPERLKKIVAAAQGFVYLISSTGTTGMRQQVSTQLPDLVKQIHAIKRIGVAVGFGISTPEQVKTVFGFAQGAIVGSYLVKKIEESEPDQLAHQSLAAFRALKG